MSRVSVLSLSLYFLICGMGLIKSISWGCWQGKLAVSEQSVAKMKELGRGFRLNFQETLPWEEIQPSPSGKQGFQALEEAELLCSVWDQLFCEEETDPGRLQTCVPRRYKMMTQGSAGGKEGSRLEKVEFIPHSAEAWHVHWGPQGNRSQTEQGRSEVLRPAVCWALFMCINLYTVPQSRAS